RDRDRDRRRWTRFGAAVIDREHARRAGGTALYRPDAKLIRGRDPIKLSPFTNRRHGGEGVVNTEVLSTRGIAKTENPRRITAHPDISTRTKNNLRDIRLVPNIGVCS